MSLLVTIPLNQEKKIHIFQGSHGKYYKIENRNEIKNSEILNNEILNYDIHFPIEWADDKNEYIHNNIQTKVGPRFCYSCINFGFYNGVFIGYCANCAYILENTRGNGLLPLGLEVSEKTVAFDITNVKEENSIWKTYLQNIEIDEIGDISVKENYDEYKDLPPLLEINE